MNTSKNSYAESSRTSDKKYESKTTSSRSNEKPHTDYKKTTLKK